MKNMTIVRNVLADIGVKYVEFDHGTFEVDVNGKSLYIQPEEDGIRIDIESPEDEQSYGVWVADDSYTCQMDKAAAVVELLHTM